MVPYVLSVNIGLTYLKMNSDVIILALSLNTRVVSNPSNCHNHWSHGNIAIYLTPINRLVNIFIDIKKVGEILGQIHTREHNQ